MLVREGKAENIKKVVLRIDNKSKTVKIVKVRGVKLWEIFDIFDRKLLYDVNNIAQEFR